MKNDDMPFVAIIGGLWMEDAATLDSAKQMARDIGAELAKAGMGLVVYFSDPQSLEPYVVTGYVAALGSEKNQKAIRVRFAQSQIEEVKFAEQSSHPQLFDLHLFPSDDWEAPFYRSLVEADGVDGVLLMAGARSTLNAGQIAIARPLPVLAIDKFKGSAGVIRTELAQGQKNYPATSTHSISDSIAWLKSKCESRRKATAAAMQRQKQYDAQASQTTKIAWTGGALVALMAALFFGVSQVPKPEHYVYLMFLGLIAAGATGALVRSVISGADETSPSKSLVLGGVAGLVVGLAYVIPQMIGAPGVLDPKADAVQATDKIQFVSAILVAISAGVGFDTVFTRMRKQAEDQKVLPTG